MTGRPTIRTPEMVDEILRRVAEGEFLATVCREDGMPHPSTFRDWVNAYEELSRRFAHAREDGEEAILAGTLAIADERDGKAIMADGQEVAVVFDSTAIQRNKLRVDTRLKALAKFNPKRWGDKLELAGNAEQPLQVVVQKKASGQDQA